jgi:phosphoribosylanthranilate isomerase
MTFVKFCGMTEERDVAEACALGVQALGFVLWPKSPRFVTAERLTLLLRSLSSGAVPVGVFVRPSTDDIASAVAAGIRVAQIHGVAWPDVSPTPPNVERWVAASVDSDISQVPEHTTMLLDADDPERHGGTGRTIDWAKAAAIAAHRRVLLAGGLTPANVAGAIDRVRPFGVDVSSGIEQRPGVKDTHAMRAFMAAVRKADQ